MAKVPGSLKASRIPPGVPNTAFRSGFFICYYEVMKITKARDVLHVKKPEGIDVHYYLFKDYEIHYNDQAPHTTQTWHHHEKIWETLYIIDGQLTAHWREADKEKSEIVVAGDLIETEHTPHTFSNNSDAVVRFLVIKRVPSDKDHSEVLKTDKVLD